MTHDHLLGVKLMAKRWTAEDIPDLAGKTIVVTGGNSGLGFEAARKLVGRGAHVVLACRDPRKAREAIEAIRSEHRDASIEAMTLDLADLRSVRRFAGAFQEQHPQLHVLCNNAGVMAIPRRSTADGFEMQFGTNHLGHFALTGLLLDSLLATPGARIVTVSSNAHRFGRICLDDLNGERGYGKWTAYAQSKLANLLFVLELNRRAGVCGADLTSVGCHPGYAATNLQFVGPRMESSFVLEKGAALLNRMLAQSAEMGALPILHAATASGVCGGDCFGPDGPAEAWGYPKKVSPASRARDRDTARVLWKVSEDLTGVRYEALPG
jgi:NAD(P)-dependent dehydrogenase (short-subunit alcohol dehydrogenase family)